MAHVNKRPDKLNETSLGRMKNADLKQKLQEYMDYCDNLEESADVNKLSADKDTNDTLAKVCDQLSLVLKDLKELKDEKASLQAEIQSLKSSNKDLTSTLRNDIKTGCAKIEQNMNIEITGMKSSFSALESRIVEVERTVSEPKAFDPDVTVVMTGFPFQENEDPSQIGTSMLKDIGLEKLPIIRAKREGARNGKQGVLVIQLTF